MKNFVFPNKRWGLFLIFLFLIFLSFFVFNKLKNKEITYNLKTPEQKITSEENIKNLSEKDTDNDGLKDWEEFLWGTDPKNPDTDEDGMNDQEETLLNRDPLVFGEGNKNTQDTQKNNLENYDPKELLTQTDLLARDIFSLYINLKQNNSLGTEDQDLLINQLIQKNLNQKEQKIKIYNLDDLKINPNSSKENIEKYAQDLKSTLSTIPELRDDNFILNEALKENDPKKLKEIENNVVYYKQLISDLLKIEVPEILQNKHLALINIFKKMSSSAEKLTGAFDDPVAVLIEAKKYYEHTDEIFSISVDIGEFFRQKNIKF